MPGVMATRQNDVTKLESETIPMSETSNTHSSATINQVFDPAALEILICPLTRSKLRLEGDVLVAEEGGLRYPIRDGIPVMLMEEAQLPEGVASLDELKQKYSK